MTGLYPQTTGTTMNGIPLPTGTKTIAEMVSSNYIRAHYGKWHLGNDTVPQHGFDEWISIDGPTKLLHSSPEFEAIEADYTHFLRANGVEPPEYGVHYESWVANAGLTEKLTQASFLGNEATRFLRNYKKSANRNRPFMLYVSFFEPHPPYTGPFNELYDPSEIPVGPAFLEPPNNGSLVNRLRADYYLGGNLNPLGIEGGDFHDTTTESGWRKLRAQYFANVTLVDRNIGRIIETLKNTGMEDDTIIVFTSDHGEMGGDHGMLEKRSLYEESVRVPAMIHVPWLSNRKMSIGGVFSQIDWVPTLLDLVNEQIPDNLDGQSRAPVFRGEASLEKNDVFLQWNGTGDRNLGTPEINQMISTPWRSIVTGDRWKLNLSTHDQCELYNLNTDPYEIHNSFNDPEHHSRILGMTARIRAELQRVGDATSLPIV